MQARENILDKKELLKWFLSDFPYKTEEFVLENPERSCLSGKDREFYEMLCDFRMLSLLMVKDASLSTIKEFYKDEIPFKECNESKFSDLDRHKFAALFFPLRTFGEHAAPSWGLVVKSDSGKTLFFNAVTQKWTSFWNYEKDGSSCRLAVALAERLVKEGNTENIYDAAKNWIVTGDVDENGNVGKVGLGNKLSLNTNKKYIVPRENHSEVSDYDRKRLNMIYSADSVESAKNIVANQGVKPLDPQDFSCRTDELHILVGESIAPQISSIILTKPAKVILWCSDSPEKSKFPAECIRKIIKRCAETDALKFDLPEFAEIEFCSESMAKAEDKLIGYFKKNSCGNKNIFFNITSSNRIMGFAVQTIARMYSDNVKLIYRDIDLNQKEEKEKTARYSFHILQYNSFPPAYGEIGAEIIGAINANWFRNGVLKSKDEKINKENLTELSERYYKNLIKTL